MDSVHSFGRSAIATYTSGVAAMRSQTAAAIDLKDTLRTARVRRLARDQHLCPPRFRRARQHTRCKTGGKCCAGTCDAADASELAATRYLSDASANLSHDARCGSQPGMLRCPALSAPSMVEQPFWATAEATKLDQGTISKIRARHRVRRSQGYNSLSGLDGVRRSARA